MIIHLCTNVIKKYFYLLYPTRSLDIVIIQMSDYQVTMDQQVAYNVTVSAQNVSHRAGAQARIYAPLIGQSTLFHRTASLAYLSHSFSLFLMELGHQFRRSIAFSR